ncbi:MAG TPA: T9SS type A sorting domain-containing protein [Bacteroidales bacterium]|nr:T9SS type A sorting domain-containing protein [Bacteroidales bacterium]HPE41315.1 T9SS type A sorting domain-containing protein [Bacteroidales bacterium]
MKNLKLILFIHFMIIFFFTNAQNPSIEWQKCIGGSNNDDAYSIIQTADGGYITVGTATSNDFDVIENQGGSTLFVVKLSNGGAIEWKKCIDGTGDVLSPKIIQNNRGGYTVSALNVSSIIDFNAYVLELDSIGNIIWKKSYGGSDFDKLNSMIQTPDGGYLFVGNTSSNDGDLQNLNFFPYNIGWIVKIDSIGNIVWQKLIGGTGYDELFNVSLTSDNGYIIAGSSTSNDGDVQGNIWVDCAWIIKLNSFGIIQWHKCIGRDNFNIAKDVKQCSDGGYIVACDKRPLYADDRDGFIVKLSSMGTIEWQKDIGGDRDDFFTSILETTDGGFIVGGTVRSYSGEIPLPYYGFEDCWIVKLSSSGNIEWQRRFGGNDSDILYSLIQTNDNGYLFAGSTKSRSNDVIGLHTTGSYPFYTDMWIVKLSPTVSTELFEKIESFQIYPNPTNSILNLNVSSELLNETYQVVNVFGQIVVSEIIVSENTPLNVSQLPKGIYLLQIGNSKTNTQKFIKN